MPLSLAPMGEISTIKRVTGKDAIRRHLAELGFVVGEQVSVVSEVGGNMIINVKGARVALGKELTSRIVI